MREDLYVYNEATGWILTSLALNGRRDAPLDADDAADWKREFARGTFLPLSLVQDDALILRLVVDESLTEQEAEEWTDHVAWKLAVPDGKLVLAGGCEYLWSGDEAECADYMQVVDVPPGDYRVDVYTQLRGVNGYPDDEDELRRYWKRTRKRERMPDWVRCDEGEDDEDESPEYVIDFVVHLMPLGAAPERPPLEDGWIPIQVRPRLPEKCPRGLVSTVVRGLTDRPVYVQTDLVYIHRVPELTADLSLTPVAGGPVEVPVEKLVLPYWLAWFTGETHPYVRVFNCPELELEFPPITEGLKGTRTGDGWQIEVEGMNARFSPFGHLRQVGALLAGLPDGSSLELAAAENEPGESEAAASDPRPGFHRYVGGVRDGSWRIEQTYPPIDRETLAGMLDLARDAEDGQGFRVRDRAEADQVLENARRHDFLLREKLPRLRVGMLKLRKADQELNPFLGAWVYLARFGAVWPAISRAEDLTGWDAAMDRIAAEGARWATGEVVLEGGFAKFTRGDMFTLAEGHREEVEAVDRAMAELGFCWLGDLNSTQTFQAVFRGYGKEDSPVFGALIKGYAAGSYEGQFYTVFEDGYSLGTSTDFRPGLDTNRHFKMMEQGGDPDLTVCHALHLEAVAAVSEKHQGARPAAPELAAFAAALDEFLVRKHMR